MLQHNPAGEVYDEELMLMHYDDLVGCQRVQLFPSVKCDQLMSLTCTYVDKLHCLCHRSSSASQKMVQCTNCDNWFYMPTCTP